MPVPAPCVTEIVQSLLRFHIVEEGQVISLQRKGPLPAEPRALLQMLLQLDWLTPLQANLLFLGRGSELCVGPYLLLQRLGKGAVGEVYKARHHYMRRLVALKLIRADQLGDADTVNRFLREIKLASDLDHPNVVHAFDAGPHGQGYFLSMEYVEGIDMGRFVQRSGPLPIAQACDYIRQAAAGLQYAHERGLVHRDVKPSNFLVSQQGEKTGGTWGLVKLLDLGLARLRRSSAGDATNMLTPAGPVMMGTPDYMAPEQAIDFHQTDQRGDIYSLGCTFYYLLTGQAPFPGGSLAQKLLRHQGAPVPLVRFRRNDAPAELDTILARMMGKRPGDRYASAGEVADALADLLARRFSLPTAQAIPSAPGLRPAAVPLAAVVAAPRASQAIPLGQPGTASGSGQRSSWLARLWRRLEQRS